MNAKDEDTTYRRAWGVGGKRPFGRGLRAGFYAYLRDSPRGAYLGREDAARYVAEIERVQEMERWPKHEAEKLRVLRLRWKRRADGLDPRYLAMGVQSGLNERYRTPGPLDRLLAMRRAIIQQPKDRAGQDADV